MKDCTKYFKENPGFYRLFYLLRDKYISLGRYSGTISLSKITEEEATAFTSFFSRTYYPMETVTISFHDISKRLKLGKYEDVTWPELMKDYFGEVPTTKKELRLAKEEDVRAFFVRLLNKYQAHPFYDWLQDEIIKKKAYLCKENRKELEINLALLLHLLEILPSQPTSLPVFASKTGNPHFLDLGTKESNLFLQALAFRQDTSFPTSHEEKRSLLLDFNIYTDPYSNFVITSHLVSTSPMIKDFLETGQIINLNMSNLLTLPSFDTKNHQVFIFENPSMMSEFQDLKVPIIITSGMPNAATYELLYQLSKRKNEMYYNGDFDPEGLLIAQKLKDRFPHLHLLNYSLEDYKTSISHEKISQSRLKKLNLVTEPALETIKQALLLHKMAAYQEQNSLRLRETIISYKKN